LLGRDYRAGWAGDVTGATGWCELGGHVTVSVASGALPGAFLLCEAWIVWQ
jgi:hypothetical protein